MAYATGGTPWTFSTPTVTFDGCMVGSGTQSSAKELREQAKAVEKRERKAKAERKILKAEAKRRDDDRETVRKNLLRVVQDESKGYASVEAAEALSTLGFI